MNDHNSTDHANPAAPVKPESAPAAYLTIHRDTISPAGQPASLDSPAASVELTERGIAEHLLALHGDDLRYLEETKSWLVWNGRWHFDRDASMLHRKVLSTLDGLQTPSSGSASDQMKQQRRARVLATLQTTRKLNGIAQMAAILTQQNEATASTRWRLRLEELDADPYLLGTPTGMVNLRDGSCTPYQREAYVMRRIATDYDATATCPRWTKFLREVFGDDVDVLDYIHRLVGYCLTGQTNHQKMWLVVGSGGNGKSTFVDILRRLLGDYAQQVPDSVLMAGARSTGPQNELVRLRGIRLGLLDESDQSGQVNENLAKRLVSSDCLVARPLYGDFQEFIPTAKFFLTTNYLPTIKGTDDGIWRRLVVLQCNRRFAVNQEPNLKASLIAELPGILAWAVAGCAAFLTSGLQEPAALQQATQAYRASEDKIGQFLDDCTLRGEDQRISAKDLADLWELWRAQNDVGPLHDNARGRALRGHGLHRGRHGHDNRHHWFGIALNENSPYTQQLRNAGTQTATPSGPTTLPLPLPPWTEEQEPDRKAVA